MAVPGLKEYVVHTKVPFNQPAPAPQHFSRDHKNDPQSKKCKKLAVVWMLRLEECRHDVTRVQGWD